MCASCLVDLEIEDGYFALSCPDLHYDLTEAFGDGLCAHMYLKSQLTNLPVSFSFSTRA